MNNIFIGHMVALLRSNQSSLTLTCLGHNNELSMTVPVRTETDLVDEISPVLDDLGRWAEIKLTNDHGRDVFHLVSDDPRQAYPSESFIGNKQSVAVHVASLIGSPDESSTISAYYLDDLELDGKKSFFNENGFSFEFQRSIFEPFKEYQVTWTKRPS